MTTLPAAPAVPRAPEQTGRFWADLRRHGHHPAVVTDAADGGTLSYADLADRVDALADRLGPTRRLVLLAGGNDLDTLVGYVAALAGGHPVLLLPGDNAGHVDAVVAAYDPDVVLDGDGLHERRPGTRHDLHPDLALLLSTSGSTGSPKLVRLSHTNLASNAGAIASYLGIRRTDVAATTLPLHYCYGLSVVNSHLAAGATLFLTDLSVVDACFWEAVRAHRVSSFAGVPYTFDLLDRVGFAGMDLPSLRYVTQAGGRLAPERVRAYAEAGQERGWDLFVMYGQTEATARMAYLPPDLAVASAGAIGVPVPGGSFRLEPVPERPLSARDGDLTVGELVYRGDNVMLGYATGPGDLARGREVHELRTGDVARRRPDGMLEVVGRRSRFAKVFGVRVDLDEVERLYGDRGHVVHVADLGDRLLLGVDASARPADPEELRAVAKEAVGLPRTAVDVLALPEVPRLPSGKTDYRTLVALAGSGARAATTADPAAPGGGRDDRSAALRAALAEVLGRDVTDADTFVGLGGDSLSYVEASIRVEAALGTLPAGWHTTPVGELAGRPATPARRGRTLETNVLLRALAIVMIVGTHANLFVAVGGAHVLLAVAGFNFGRFHLTDAPRRERVRHVLGSVARIAVPAAVWLAGVALLTGDIGWRNVLLLNGVLGPTSWTEPAWWYWFVEVLVWTLVALAGCLAVPWFDGVERRWSFWLPFGLALAGLLTRYDVVELSAGDEIHRGTVVFWLFALGWATVKATRLRHRLLVSAVAVASVPGFFEDGPREAVVVAGVLLLVWLSSVRVPDVVARAAAVLASASLYIYLAHWQVYPHLEDDAPLLATLLSLLAGIVFWKVASRAGNLLGTHAGPRPKPRARASQV
ncbi:AMP-binding protein [Nocardioides iriomotensis]|uniref:AMP-dependent synthetase n=1 Tax=Nocardioides iriomotensis TaxID=715784 RepID=A0A4Q5J6A5_9ACTN|nr:AMP-binding protein [Nocardioides iriomotensis]RYU13368.1 AMP-dependent synthetase [Nocardioides iriomotensis]